MLHPAFLGGRGAPARRGTAHRHRRVGLGGSDRCAAGRGWCASTRREIAADLGVPVAAGLALVGAFAALTGVADDEALATATRQLVPPHRAAALEANLAALAAGAEAVRGTPVGIGS